MSTVVFHVACTLDDTTLEADSHADTTCLGRVALVLFAYGQLVNVHGYNPALGTKQFRTVSGGLAYTHPFTGLRYQLIIHQTIHMPDLEHHLIHPIQCRANGTIVKKCP